MHAAGLIRAVMFREGDMWVAQCLEYDIGAQGKDLADLAKRLALTIELERSESINRLGKPFAGIDPAPERFHEMWERRTGQYHPTTPIRVRFRNDGDGEVPVELALCA